MPLSAGTSLATSNNERLAGPRRWRPFAVSAACFVLGVVIFGIQIETLEEDGLSSYENGLLLWDFLVGFVAVIAVGPMSRAGRWNYLLLLASAVSAFATPAALVAVVRLGGLRRRRDDVAVLALLVATGLVQTALTEQRLSLDWSTLLWSLIMVPIGYAFLAWGRSRAERAELLASRQAQAIAAQRERAAIEREHAALARSKQIDAERARSEERTAIARDMHDSLSHHLSLIAMHAGALAYREDLSPEQMRATARTLRDAAGTANAELREVLSALRSPTPDARPLPSARDVLTLVEDARAQGRRVTVSFEGLEETDLGTLTGTNGAAVHRIVSELVVNAGKHAPDAPLALTFRRDEDALVVVSTNPTAASSEALSTGLGLVGVGERVRLIGGTMNRRETPGYFTVEVRIPWRS